MLYFAFFGYFPRIPLFQDANLTSRFLKNKFISQESGLHLRVQFWGLSGKMLENADSH